MEGSKLVKTGTIAKPDMISCLSFISDLSLSFFFCVGCVSVRVSRCVFGWESFSPLINEMTHNLLRTVQHGYGYAYWYRKDMDTCIGIGSIRIHGYGNSQKKPIRRYVYYFLNE